jgi:hypothetical protein
MGHCRDAVPLCQSTAYMSAAHCCYTQHTAAAHCCYSSTCSTQKQRAAKQPQSDNLANQPHSAHTKKQLQL